MFPMLLAMNPDLSARSRLRPALPRALSAEAMEIALLISMGVLAAALTAFVRIRLRIPGHAIVLPVLPMSFALSVAPRRKGGLLMGLSAVVTMLVMNASHTSIPLGAITSVGLFGLLLDFAARGASCGKMFYLRFAAAGLASNAVAFAAKVLEKQSGLNPASRPYAEWISVAPVSFAICGLVAGLIGAALFFQFGEGATCGREQGRAPARPGESA